MINLLPPELKQNYSYARRSSSLLRIVSAFGIGIAGVVLIAAAGFFYLHRTAGTYNAQAALREADLKKQNQAAIIKEVTTISANLKLAVQVLSKEVLFSKLVSQLTIVTPSRVSLSNINIAKFGGGVDIMANTANNEAATQLLVNLSDPDNKIFSKVDMVSINCQADTSSLKSSYPCTAVYRALFASDNPFVFINPKAGNP